MQWKTTKNMFGGTEYETITIYKSPSELNFVRTGPFVGVNEYYNTKLVDNEGRDLGGVFSPDEAANLYAMYLENGYTTEWVGSEEV